MDKDRYKLSPRDAVYTRKNVPIEELVRDIASDPDLYSQDRAHKVALFSAFRRLAELLKEGGRITRDGKEISITLDAPFSPKDIIISPNTHTVLAYKNAINNGKFEPKFYIVGNGGNIGSAKKMALAFQEHIQRAYEDAQVPRPRLSSWSAAAALLVHLSGRGELTDIPGVRSS